MNLFSLVLTCASALCNPISFACIGYDMFSLIRAKAQGSLFTWQSAISVFSIVLTIASLIALPHLSIASIVLDMIMLIHVVSKSFAKKK